MAAMPEVDINEATRCTYVTVKVTGVRAFTWRLKMCLVILRFASWVCPVSMFIEVEGPE